MIISFTKFKVSISFESFSPKHCMVIELCTWPCFHPMLETNLLVQCKSRRPQMLILESFNLFLMWMFILSLYKNMPVDVWELHLSCNWHSHVQMLDSMTLHVICCSYFGISSCLARFHSFQFFKYHQQLRSLLRYTLLQNLNLYLFHIVKTSKWKSLASQYCGDKECYIPHLDDVAILTLSIHASPWGRLAPKL